MIVGPGKAQGRRVWHIFAGQLHGSAVLEPLPLNIWQTNNAAELWGGGGGASSAAPSARAEVGCCTRL